MCNLCLILEKIVESSTIISRIVKKKETFARELYYKDVGEFWCAVKHLNRSSSLLFNCIDGVTNEKNIFIICYIFRVMTLI